MHGLRWAIHGSESERISLGDSFDGLAFEWANRLRLVEPDVLDRPVLRQQFFKLRLLHRRIAAAAARADRPQPARDGKAIAAWNGLAIAALGFLVLVIIAVWQRHSRRRA